MCKIQFVLPLLFCLTVASEKTDSNWWYKKADMMVKQQIEKRGVQDEGVLRAMRKTPRHLFVPENLKDRAYEDGPLPISKSSSGSK